MAPLSILSDTDVKNILHYLRKQDVHHMQISLRKALHEYSTAHQEQPECAANQPDRIKMKHETGSTTLFMPSMASAGIGMKVVTLAAPKAAPPKEDEETEGSKDTPQGGLMLMDPAGKPFAFINAEEMTAFRTALASSLLMVRRKKVETITVFGSGKQAFWHVRLALMFHGPTVKNVHIITRRFSMSSKQFMQKLMSIDSSTKEKEGWFSTRFGMISPAYHEYHRMAKEQIRSADIIICATSTPTPLFDHSILTNANGRLKGRLIIGVGSYTPSMTEVPPELYAQAVKQHGSHHHFRKRATEGGCVLVDTVKARTQVGELISAQLKENHVVEIGEIVLLDEQFAHEGDEDDESAIDDETEPRASTDNSSNSFNLSDGKSSLASALSETANGGSGSRRSSRSNSRTGSRSGSFSGISSASASTSLIFRRRKHELGDHGHVKKQSKDEMQMTEWLCKGNVIYKSVGLGLMDLVVGTDIVVLAKQMGVGTTVGDFD